MTSCELLSKILYLCSLKQRTTIRGRVSKSCELLSKILYLCSLKQLATIEFTNELSCELLSKILYLCSLKQHTNNKRGRMVSCELLSKILYLCSLKQHDMGNTKSFNNLDVVSEKKNPARKSGVFHCFAAFFRFKTAPTAGKACQRFSACSC